jgi:hypothetical protein
LRQIFARPKPHHPERTQFVTLANGFLMSTVRKRFWADGTKSAYQADYKDAKGKRRAEQFSFSPAANLNEARSIMSVLAKPETPWDRVIAS